MPTYLFRCNDCGRIAADVRSMSCCGNEQICLCGGEMARDLRAEHSEAVGHAGNWPLTSLAAGVAPSQVFEAKAIAAKKGVPIEFTKTGEAIFTSRSHRKRYCETIGLHDRNGGYGDP